MIDSAEQDFAVMHLLAFRRHSCRHLLGGTGSERFETLAQLLFFQLPGLGIFQGFLYFILGRDHDSEKIACLFISKLYQNLPLFFSAFFHHFQAARSGKRHGLFLHFFLNGHVFSRSQKIYRLSGRTALSIDAGRLVFDERLSAGENSEFS